MNRLFLIIFFLFSLTVHAEEVIDLTHPFNEKTIYWPSAGDFVLHHVFEGKTQKGYFYSGYTFEAPEHGGTHLDAPYHFFRQGWKVDEIPPSHLVSPAVVLDFSALIRDQADYSITEKDIRLWEKKKGPIPPRSIVLIRTGWDRFWSDKKKYLGTDQKGDITHLHFPGLSRKAALYLVKCQVLGVGLDTASLDPGNSKDFWAHRILLGNNIFGIENVASLKKLLGKSFIFVVAPMKIEGGTGAPVRLLAIMVD